MRFHLKQLVALPKPPQPLSPAQADHARERAEDVQNLAADGITRFAGSMTFVYIHVIWFASWIGFGVESWRRIARTGSCWACRTRSSRW